MISPESKTLALVRGQPFSGKTQLAMYLAARYSHSITRISKDEVAEEGGFSRANGVQYTPDVRRDLYLSFQMKVEHALNSSTPIIIAEAPFSRAHDVLEFVAGQREKVDRILILTLNTSIELREQFISMGRRQLDGSPRQLIGFEQDDGTSGEFDTDIVVPGCQVERLDIGLPFSKEVVLQQASALLRIS